MAPAEGDWQAVAPRSGDAEILVAEAEFRGLVHATFNAHLLEAICRGWPECVVRFLAEPRHVAEVERLVAERADGVRSSLSFGPLEIGARYHPPRAQELAIGRRLLEESGRCGARLLVLTSATWTQLLGMCLRPRPAKLAASFCALHTQAVAFRGSGARGWLSARLRRAALDRLGPLRGLLVFSESARRVAEREVGLRRRPVIRIDPPYARAAAPVAPRREGVRIGWIGNTEKGPFSRFVEIAARARAETPECEFALVGYLAAPLAEADAALFVEPPSREMLASERFAERLAALSHAVIWSESSRYEYRISAAFLDAVAWRLPGIYFSTPFLEEFFARFGPCGRLCSSAAEMEAAIRAACRGEDRAERESWRRNLDRAAEALSPRHVGARLREAVEACLADASRPGGGDR